MNIREYINENLKLTIRSNVTDDGTLIGLPKPYTVPCVQGSFQEMYYWDTYFTNVGLIRMGLLEQARNNIENMCYLIDKFGFMLNGNRLTYLTRSQPPFLSQMVREYFEQDADKEFLAKCFASLEKEYEYWQKRRITDSGLNRYYGHFSKEKELDYGYKLCKRYKIDPPEDEKLLRDYGKSLFSFAESGWDCCSRMGMHPYNWNWVDLNALLYGLETNMVYFSKVLENGKEEYWQGRADIRKAKMNGIMWDESLGAFCDYNFVTKEKSDVVSVAMFYPMFTGLCTDEQAERIVSLLPRLEMEHGIACCEERDDIDFLQWDYPNGWACLHHIVIHSLLRYGYKDKAMEIARGYVKLVENVFEKTGQLWEKYNVVTGEVSTAKEYDTPTMMGWSAGVYLDCCALLSE